MHIILRKENYVIGNYCRTNKYGLANILLRKWLCSWNLLCNMWICSRKLFLETTVVFLGIILQNVTMFVAILKIPKGWRSLSVSNNALGKLFSGNMSDSYRILLEFVYLRDMIGIYWSQWQKGVLGRPWTKRKVLINTDGT